VNRVSGGGVSAGGASKRAFSPRGVPPKLNTEQKEARP
jgi:hypothetical protein